MRAVILASLLGSAAGAAVVTGTINYSSPFRVTFPIDSAFHVVPSVANIWSWTGPADGAPILVDINGDGVMDTSDPGVKVVITDFKIHGATTSTGHGVEIVDAGGVRWFGHSHPNTLASDHFSTPIVLATGSDLWLNSVGLSSPLTVTLIGRVQNL